MMKLDNFDYTLPETLIARYPCQGRSASRLLILNATTGDIQHKIFSDLTDFIGPHDLLVLNDSKVMPARLWGQKESGGKIEVLIERLLDDHRALAHVHSNRSLKIGASFTLAAQIPVKVIGRKQSLFELIFLHEKPVIEILEIFGHVPLPPYIDRPDELMDQSRYQTIYAKHPGSVAAPTAGLHFDETLLQQLQLKGINTAFLTLHVGAGTFQPVRVDDITQHQMHAETIEISDAVCQKIKSARAQDGKIIAVGTTSVRSLETLAQMEKLQPYFGETNIFIYPGYHFQCVDAIITNFHLPKSTLLMLVCAFAGQDNVMRAYQEAIREQYRFYSYGDAMLIVK